MIVDLRIYTVRPGKVDAFLAIYREKAWPLQLKHLGRCLGWYTSIEGQLNRVIHLWAYDSQADREARRGRMVADPEWGAYMAAIAEAGLLVSMENSIVRQTPFFAEHSNRQG